MPSLTANPSADEPEAFTATHSSIDLQTIAAGAVGSVEWEWFGFHTPNVTGLDTLAPLVSFPAGLWHFHTTILLLTMGTAPTSGSVYVQFTTYNETFTTPHSDVVDGGLALALTETSHWASGGSLGVEVTNDTNVELRLNTSYFSGFRVAPSISLA